MNVTVKDLKPIIKDKFSKLESTTSTDIERLCTEINDTNITLDDVNKSISNYFELENRRKFKVFNQSGIIRAILMKFNTNFYDYMQKKDSHILGIYKKGIS